MTLPCKGLKCCTLKPVSDQLRGGKYRRFSTLKRRVILTIFFIVFEAAIFKSLYREIVYYSIFKEEMVDIS